MTRVRGMIFLCGLFFMAAVCPGAVIRVKVHSAQGLPANTDFGPNNLTDAYVIPALVSNMGSSCVKVEFFGKTRVVANSRDPRWEQDFSLEHVLNSVVYGADSEQARGQALMFFVFDDKKEKCLHCRGTGVVHDPQTCPKCGGAGSITVSKKCWRCGGDGFIGDNFKWQKKRSCPICRGQGKISNTKKCWRCGGDGKINDILRKKTCPFCKGSGIRAGTAGRLPALIGVACVTDLLESHKNMKLDLAMPLERDPAKAFLQVMGGDDAKKVSYRPILRQLLQYNPFRWVIRPATTGSIFVSTTTLHKVPSFRNSPGIPAFWAKARRISIVLKHEHGRPMDAKEALLRTEPPSGTLIQTGASLSLFLADGKFAMPAFTGQRCEMLKQQLKQKYGFKNIEFKPKEAVGQAGVVLSQSPAAGTLVDRDSRVVIVYAIPPDPKLPSFVGKSIAFAKNWARRNHLRVTVSTVASGSPAGRVVDQTPAPGARLSGAKGVLALAVSTGSSVATGGSTAHGAPGHGSAATRPGRAPSWGSDGFTVGLSSNLVAVGGGMSVKLRVPDSGDGEDTRLALYETADGKRLSDEKIKAGFSGEKTVTAPDMPGNYEIRVLHGKKLKAWAAFSTVLPLAASAIGLAKDCFVVGEELAVDVKIPENVGIYRPWIALYKEEEIVPGGGVVRERRLEYKNITGRRKKISFRAPDEPGAYLFRLFRDDSSDQCIAQAHFSVITRADDSFVMLDKTVYRPGEPVKITVAVPGGQYFERAWMGLYEPLHEVPGGASVRQRRLDTMKVKSRSCVVGIKAPDKAGRYEIRLFDRDEDRFILARRSFDVVIPYVKNAMSLSKNTYLIGEKITLSIKLPAGTYIDRPWVGLYMPRHKVPGGGCVRERRLEYKKFGKIEDSIEFTAPDRPGAYEFRLFDRDEGYYIIDDIGFSVEARRAPGAIKLARTLFRAGQAMEVAVEVPGGLYFNRGWIGLYRSETTFSGGAARRGTRLEYKNIRSRRCSVKFKAPDLPGGYEFRLFDRDEGYYIIDDVDFRVEVPSVDGALSLPSKVSRCGDRIVVNIALGEDVYLHNPWVGMYIPDCRTRGGGLVLGRRLETAKVKGRKCSVSFTAPSRPCWLLFKLFDRDEGYYIIDTVGAKVIDPKKHFPDYLVPPFEVAAAQVTRQGAAARPGGADQASSNKGIDVAELARKALALLQQGRFRQSEELYRKVVCLAPRDHRYVHDLGVAIYRQGDARYEEAEDCFKRAIQLKSDYYLAYKSYGAMLGKKGDYDGALRELEKAESLCKSDPMVYHNLALTCVLRYQKNRNRVDLKKAYEWSKKAMALKPPPSCVEQHRKIEAEYKRVFH